MSGFSFKNVRYPRYQDIAFLQLWPGSKLTETHSTTEQQVLVAKCVTINTEGNTITEIRGYSHIDRYYKGLTTMSPLELLIAPKNI